MFLGAHVFLRAGFLHPVDRLEAVAALNTVVYLQCGIVREDINTQYGYPLLTPSPTPSVRKPRTGVYNLENILFLLGARKISVDVNLREYSVL
jgi:hypothetical protein